jgi:hypothetical protein
LRQAANPKSAPAAARASDLFAGLVARTSAPREDGSSEALRLRGVPELELRVNQDCKRAGPGARNGRTGEPARQDGEREPLRHESERLERPDRQHSASEEKRGAIDEEDAGRLDVPGVAVRHPARLHHPRDGEERPLIAARAVLKDQEKKRKDDKGGGGDRNAGRANGRRAHAAPSLDEESAAQVPWTGGEAVFARRSRLNRGRRPDRQPTRARRLSPVGSKTGSSASSWARSHPTQSATMSPGDRRGAQPSSAWTRRESVR